MDKLFIGILFHFLDGPVDPFGQKRKRSDMVRLLLNVVTLKSSVKSHLKSLLLLSRQPMDIAVKVFGSKLLADIEQ